MGIQTLLIMFCPIMMAEQSKLSVQLLFKHADYFELKVYTLVENSDIDEEVNIGKAKMGIENEDYIGVTM